MPGQAKTTPIYMQLSPNCPASLALDPRITVVAEDGCATPLINTGLVEQSPRAIGGDPGEPKVAWMVEEDIAAGDVLYRSATHTFNERGTKILLVVQVLCVFMWL